MTRVILAESVYQLATDRRLRWRQKWWVVGYLYERRRKRKCPTGTNGHRVKLGHFQTETLRAEARGVLSVLGLKVATGTQCRSMERLNSCPN
jgi:hypothetical protein